MRWFGFVLCVVVLLGWSTVQAQEGEDFLSVDESDYYDSEPSPNDSEPEDASPMGETDSADSDEDQAAITPKKPPEWFLGVDGQLNWIPHFFQELFLDEAPAIVGPGLSVLATHRDPKDGFSVVFGLGYMSYATDGPYRAMGDPDTDTEYIHNSLGLAYATASLLWSAPIDKMFTFEYGFGLDFGIVTGELRRTEAYPDPTSDSGYSPCRYARDPAEWEAYCASPAQTDINVEGEHYNLVEDSIVPVMAFPAIPQLALRFSPVEIMAIKAKLAYGIAQFTFGLSLDIGIDAL